MVRLGVTVSCTESRPATRAAAATETADGLGRGIVRLTGTEIRFCSDGTRQLIRIENLHRVDFRRAGWRRGRLVLELTDPQGVDTDVHRRAELGAPIVIRFGRGENETSARIAHVIQAAIIERQLCVALDAVHSLP